MKKRIAILGSTGSIGKQVLEVIERNHEKFRVEVLTANQNADLLIQQAMKFHPNAITIANKTKYEYVQNALRNQSVKVYAGIDGLEQIVTMKTIDMVLVALTGYAGFEPTINAIKAGKDIALANKETMVVGGKIIIELAETYHCNIYPVDSEHSAILQCLTGERHNSLHKIYLTASGGPFRNKSSKELEHVTKDEALQHPTWCMGDKITIDSATLMNKGLEVIEARWLFRLRPEQIEVIIHPQSIIHSIVEFSDGSLKAQMGTPDMRIPIQYALSYPERLSSDFERFNFTKYPRLTFEKPDTKKFRALSLAYKAVKSGGNMPCALNAANEAAVEAFLNDHIRFLDIPEIIENTMDTISFISNATFEDLKSTHIEAQKKAYTIIQDMK